MYLQYTQQPSLSSLPATPAALPILHGRQISSIPLPVHSHLSSKLLPCRSANPVPKIVQAG